MGTVDLFVAMELNRVLFALFFNFDGGHILEFILPKRYLKDENMGETRGLFHDADVIDLLVTIQIQIVDTLFRIIQ